MFDVRRLFAGSRPSLPSGPLERGAEALLRGAHALALEEFDSAVEASPGNAGARPAAYNKRGVALVALGRPDDALLSFCAALECDDRCAPALVNIGNRLLEDGEYLDAVDYYEAALRADEGYHLAHRNLGIAFKRLGRRPEAVRAFRAAARLEAHPRRGRA